MKEAVPRTAASFTSLAPADDAVLRALLRFHYLNSHQLCVLLYTPRSLTYVQTKLRHLTESGYCQRIWIPRPSRRGSAPSVFTLARKGLDYLRAQGIEVPPRYRPSEQRKHAYLFLAHTMAVNDVLSSAELFCRQAPRLELAATVHERDVKRCPVRVEDADGTAITVIPDGWLDLRLDGTYQICLVLELDRGTKSSARGAAEFESSSPSPTAPTRLFQTRSLTTVVYDESRARRLLDLLRWTERELLALKEQAQADLIVITAVVPEAIVPQALLPESRLVPPVGE